MNADDLAREVEALRDRLSRLSEAGLRINEDLDVDTVLQGVLDAARSLTGAMRGGLTTVDDGGQLEDFITSGLTEEEHRRFLGLPGGLRFFAYLSGIPEPAEAGGLLRLRRVGGPSPDRPPAGAG